MTGPGGWTWTEHAVVTRHGLICPLAGPEQARAYVLNGCVHVHRTITATPEHDSGRAHITAGWWTDHEPGAAA